MRPRNVERHEALLRVARRATPEDPAELVDFAAALMASGGSLNQYLTRAVRAGLLVRIRPGVYVRGPKA